MSIEAVSTWPDADWYHRNYPNSAVDVEPRCFAVLAAWGRLYNIGRNGLQRPDGGFRQVSNGIEVRIPAGNLSTYDDAGLTRLVIAAHRYRCRVQISSRPGNVLSIYVTPRSHESGRIAERHPSLVDLADEVVVKMQDQR